MTQLGANEPVLHSPLASHTSPGSAASQFQTTSRLVGDGQDSGITSRRQMPQDEPASQAPHAGGCGGGAAGWSLKARAAATRNEHDVAINAGSTLLQTSQTFGGVFRGLVAWIWHIPFAVHLHGEAPQMFGARSGRLFYELIQRKLQTGDGQSAGGYDRMRSLLLLTSAVHVLCEV